MVIITRHVPHHPDENYHCNNVRLGLYCYPNFNPCYGNDILPLFVQAMTSIPQDILLQVISILLKVRIVVCEEEDDPNNLTSESLISLFTNYKNKKLRVNINVPMKTEMKVRSPDFAMRVIYKSVINNVCMLSPFPCNIHAFLFCGKSSSSYIDIVFDSR